jgi:hypothetical protein
MHRWQLAQAISALLSDLKKAAISPLEPSLQVAVQSGGDYYEKKCTILSARRMGGPKAPAASGAQDLRLTSAVTIVMAIHAQRYSIFRI